MSQRRELPARPLGGRSARVSGAFVAIGAFSLLWLSVPALRSGERRAGAADGVLSVAHEWSWASSTAYSESRRVEVAPIVVDLNGDRMPEVVFQSSVQNATGQYIGVLRAVSGKDGSELFSVSLPTLDSRRGLAAGDLDGDGLPEIVTGTRYDELVAFGHDGSYKWTSPKLNCWGNLAHPAIADIDHDGVSEIAACATLLNADGTIRWQRQSAATGIETTFADINMSGDLELIDGSRVYASDGSVLWEVAALPVQVSVVGNLEGDSFPEVVMIGDDDFYIVDHTGRIAHGPIRLPRDIPTRVPSSAGSPTIADVDGDGWPEIGVAAYGRYSMFERDGALKWSVPVGGFAFFRGAAAADLDGNGALEIVFQGAATLRLLRGVDGVTLWQYDAPAGGRSGFYNQPVIADIDMDSHSEIVSSWTYEAGSIAPVPGIQVFGNDSWMPSRPIWNQHTYHITNINDDGTIPRYEEPSWIVHNNFRANERQEGPFPSKSLAFVPIAIDESKLPARKESDIVLAIDTSVSMAGAKLEAATMALEQLLDRVHWNEDRVGIVAFSQTADLRQVLTGDRLAVERTLSQLTVSPGTRLEEGLKVARAELLRARSSGGSAAPVIVVLTDGQQESGREQALQEADALHALGAAFYAIGLGEGVEDDFVRDLAVRGGGQSFLARNSENLSVAFREIGRQLACQPGRFWGHRC